VFILSYKLLTWELRDILISLLDNPKTDLRVYRNPSFKVMLKNSLRIHGLLDPLKVRIKNDRYEIIDGVTRKLDLLELNVKSVQCLVTECDDETALLVQAQVSKMRYPLDPMGFSNYVKIMHDKGKTLSTIGEPFGLKKAQVSKYLCIARHLCNDDKIRLAQREISVEYAYIMARDKKNIGEMSFRLPKQNVSCPSCDEIVSDESILYKKTVCPFCDDLFIDALERYRKFKQMRFKKVTY